MLLTSEQLKTVITGCTAFEEEDGGLWLSRYSPAQRAIFDEPIMQYLTRACAGVTMDFYTDATTLTLRVDGLKVQDSDRRDFDLLIDGLLVRKIDIFSLEAGPCRDMTMFRPQDVVFELPEGEKRVTVCFSWQTPVRILSAELENATFFRPHTYEYTWLAFGDSITHGASADFPSMSYVNQTARNLNAKVYNYGLGGEMYREDWIVPGTYPKADFVTVALGTNDCLYQKKELFERYMPAFYAQVAKEFADVPVYVILPAWRRFEGRGGSRELGTLPQVRQRIANEIAQYPNMTAVSAERWVPRVREFYGEDLLLHPNDLGMTHYAAHLTAFLREKLAK